MADLNDLDDFSLDDLDMDFDIDGNPEDDAENRTPLERAATGAVDSILSTDTLGKVASTVARNGLPEGFSSAFTTADKVVNETSKLYDLAKEEIKGPLSRLKKTINENVDSLPGFVSDDLKDKIKDYTKTEDTSLGEATAFDPDKATIDSTLGNIFTLDAEKETLMAEAEAGQRKADLGIKSAEAKLQAKFQSEQAISSKITYQWQRKTLELQHRQFFIARDTLALLKADALDAKTSRAAIVKNTGLPDFLKTRSTENLAQINQMGLLTNVSEAMHEYAGNVGAKLMENLSGKVREGAAGLGGVTDMLDSLLSAGDSGIDGVEMAGGMVAEGALEGLTGRFSRRLREYLKDNPQVMERSAQLQYMIENAGMLTEERLRNYDGFGSDLLKELMPSFSGNRVKVTDNLAETANEASMFDNLTHRSINEIIPGFLSRILQQVTQANTGKDEQLVTYSTDSETFVTQKEAADNLRKRLFRNVSRSNDYDLGEILKILDPDNKLSEEERTKLGDRIVEDAADGSYRFKASDYLPEGSSLSHQDTLKASRRFSSINSSSNIQKDINAAIKRGDRELLRSLGIIEDVEEGPQFSRVNQSVVSNLLQGRDTFKEESNNQTTVNTRTGKATVDNGTMDITGAMDVVESLRGSIREIGADTSMALMEELEGVNAVPVRIVQNIADMGVGNSPNDEPPMLNIVTEGFKITHELLAAIEAKTGLNLGTIEDIQNSSKLGNGMLRSRMSGLASGIIDSGTNFVNSYFKNVSNIGGGLFNKGGELLGKGKDLLGKGLGAFRETDIYALGSKLPALEARKLKLGQYRDQVTGKIITSIEDLKDLKGSVVDELGNVVLTAEEIGKGLVTSTGVKLSGIIGKLTNPLTAAFNFQTNAFNYVMKVPGLLKAGFDKAAEYVGDVYIAGEKSPRLLSQVMKNGGYVSSVTGKVITKLSEIDGDVLDKAGRVVLTLDDVRNGLFKRNGLRINIGSFSKLKNVLSTAKNAVTGVLKAGLNTGRSLFEGFGDIAGAGLSRMASGIEGRGGKWTQLIYEHMVKKWPVSAEDQIQSEVTERSRGFFSSIRAMFNRQSETMSEVSDSLKGKMEEGKEAAKERLNEGKERAAEMRDVLKEGLDVVREETSQKFSEAVETLKESTKAQTETIRETFTRKKVKGDADGDGDRDGSFRDILSRRGKKEDTKEANKDKDDKEEEQSPLGRLASVAMMTLPAIVTGIGALGTAVMGIGSTIASYFAAKTGMDFFSGDGKKTKGGPGKASKLMQGAKNMASKAGVKTIAAGSALKAGAGKAVAGFAARRAAVAGAGSVAAATGATVGGIALAPVIAAAGAAWATYEVATFFIDRMDAEPLEAIRFLQYGLDISEGYQLSRIREFESELIDEYIKINGKSVQFTGDLVTIREEYANDIFDVDMESNEQVVDFDIWFSMRFLPVFMTHLGAITGLDKGVDLTDIDDEIEDEHVVQFLTAVMLDPKKFDSGKYPLSISSSPYPGFTSLTNQENIRSTADSIMENFKEDSKPKDLAVYGKRKRKVSNSKDEELDALGLMGKDADAIVNGKLGYSTRKHKVKVDPKLKIPKAAKQLEIEGKKKGNGRDLIIPVEGGRISSPYGPRVHPITGERGKHKGIDIAAPTGTPVYAASDGVIYRQYRSESYGNVIYLKHTDGKASRYAHLHSFADGTGVGVEVLQGQLLGYVGNTGKSKGPHLHWEVRDNTDQYASDHDPLKLVNSNLKRKVTQQIKDTEESISKGKEDSGYDDADDSAEGLDTIGVTTQTAEKTATTVGDIVIDQAAAKADKKANVAANVPASNPIDSIKVVQDKGTMDELRKLNDLIVDQEKYYDKAVMQRDVMIDNLGGIKELLHDVVSTMGSLNKEPPKRTTVVSGNSSSINVPVPMRDS